MLAAMPSLAPGETTLAERLEAGPLRADAVARLGVQACRELAVSPLTSSSRRGFCPAAIRLDTSPEGDVAVGIRNPDLGRGVRPSPMYLSPEQVTHASPPDARSDVYSLSTVLYEALSGELPLPRCATEGELLTALVTHDPQSLSTAAPWLDPELCRVVERGLQREPARRWPSLRELGDALLPFTGGSEHISADMLAGITAGERVLRARARAQPPAPSPWRPAAVAASALAVLGLVASAVRLTANVWRTGHEIADRTSPAVVVASPAPPQHTKKEVAVALLEKPSFFIHLDPRRPGVVVPEKFRAQSQLVLQVGRELAVPIPDFSVDDAGITGTLSFSHKPFLCKIPWPAVYALVDESGRGQVWSADGPPEVAAEAARKKAAGDAEPP